MPGAIDFETMDVDDLSPVWFPEEAGPEPEQREAWLHQQARAHLLTMVGTPEAVLRLLLRETDVARVPADDVAAAPGDEGFPAEAGDADAEPLPSDSFEFARPAVAQETELTRDGLQVIYRVDGAGTWRLILESDRVTIERI